MSASARSGAAAHSGASPVRRRSSDRHLGRLQPLAPLDRDLHAFSSQVVVADEDGPTFGGEPSVRAHLVLELEALRPQPGRAHPDLDPFAQCDRRAEVDLDAREDQVLLRVVARTVRLEVRDARRLHVRREDGVVDVAHAVQVAKTNRIAEHEGEPVHAAHGIDGLMAGEKTREAVFAQPDWLRQVPADRRLPAGRALFTGCGTSYHAALTGGNAVQALELVLEPDRNDAGVLVAISHEGGTAVTLEAVRAWNGPTWLVTGAPESPIAVAAPRIEESWCHTASYTSAVAAIAALRGEDVSWLADAVAAELERGAEASDHARFLIAGAGRD